MFVCLQQNAKQCQGSLKIMETKFHDFSMTKLAIFPDHFHGKDGRNFPGEIHHWTILGTITSMTIFSMQIRGKIAIFHNHLCGWESSKFFMRSS